MGVAQSHCLPAEDAVTSAWLANVRGGGLSVDHVADHGSGSCSLEQQSRRATQFQATILAGTEQSLNNSLPNTTYQQVLTRATGTKNPRAQPPALRSPETVSKESSSFGFDDLQTQLCGPFLEQLHLLFAV